MLIKRMVLLKISDNQKTGPIFLILDIQNTVNQTLNIHNSGVCPMEILTSIIIHKARSQHINFEKVFLKG